MAADNVKVDVNWYEIMHIRLYHMKNFQGSPDVSGFRNLQNGWCNFSGCNILAEKYHDAYHITVYTCIVIWFITWYHLHDMQHYFSLHYIYIMQCYKLGQFAMPETC